MYNPEAYEYHVVYKAKPMDIVAILKQRGNQWVFEALHDFNVNELKEISEKLIELNFSSFGGPAVDKEKQMVGKKPLLDLINEERNVNETVENVLGKFNIPATTEEILQTFDGMDETIFVPINIWKAAEIFHGMKPTLWADPETSIILAPLGPNGPIRNDVNPVLDSNATETLIKHIEKCRTN